MKTLKAQYRDLEMKTIFKLKDLIDIVSHATQI
jgi:hypothetical protein